MASVPTPWGANNNTSPAQDGYAITPSDTANFASPFRAIYVGVGGDITLVTMGGTTLLFVGVPQGAILPQSGVRVNATATAATSLIGMV